MQLQWNKTTGPTELTHLREIEESWLTEQDVSQEHGATRQHFNLVFTEMMAPQEFSKVPETEEQVGHKHSCYHWGYGGDEMSKTLATL